MRKVIKKRLSSSWIGKLLIAVIIISVAGASTVYWILGKRIEESLVEQMLHRQQVVARAGAISIEDFLASVGSSVSSYAQLDEVIEGGDSAQARLDSFVKRWLDTPVFSVALTDEEGVVVISANRQGTGQTGDSLGSRDYFQWAKDKSQPGEVFIGKAIFGRFGSVKDKYLVPVAAGVFSQDEFKGVLISTVVLSELTKSHLDPLRISEETRIFLIDSKGGILQAPYEQFIGKNYFEYLSKVNFKSKGETLEQLWKAVFSSEEGKLDINLPNELTGKIDRFLISYAPIKYQDSEHWTLAVASPINTALVFFPQFYNQQMGVLLFILFVVISLSALGILTIRLVQRESFYEGFAIGREASKRTSSKRRSTSG